MLLLPAPAGESSAIALPVSEAAVDRLVAALLAGDAPHAEALLAEALAADPPLALWCILQAAHDSGEPLRTVPRLAEWLSHRMLRLLEQSRTASSACEWAEASRAACAELARQSLSVAYAAQNLAQAEGRSGEEAFLLGLLHNARVWLNSAVSAEKAGPEDRVLPAWLDDELRALARSEGPSAKGPVHYVAAVIGQLEASDSSAESPSLAAGGQINGSGSAANWVLAQPGATARLAALIEKLSRLEALEHDFAGRLQSEKIEAIKELAYGAGHEINNPLANISARAQTLLREEIDPERRRKLAAINAQAFRAHEMIADMMLFARPPAVKATALDLGTLIEEAVGELRERADGQMTELDWSPPSPAVELMADRSQVAVAVRALVTNALEAIGRGGRVAIEVRGPRERSSGVDRAVEIVVSDSGPGIPAEVRSRLFDPFFSGREAGRGLGMGLCKVWTIATSHGGSIVVDSTGLGAAFTLRLPVELRAKAPSSASRTVAKAAASPGLREASRTGP